VKGAFPSEAFFVSAVEAFNEDAESAAAARGWSGDFGIVVEGFGALHVGAPVDGRLPPPRLVARDELLELEPTYFARADVETWRALVLGALDPIAAIVQKKLELTGDLTPVIQRLTYRGLAERWLARIRRGM
jgi:hypothetical protein